MKRYRTLSWQQQNPVAGAGAVIVPSPIQRVRLYSLMFTFTADAVVANRFVWLRILDPNNVPVFGTGSGTAIAASTAVDFIASPASGSVNNAQAPVNAAIGLDIPNMWLPPNWRIQLGAKAIDPGDQFSAISYAADFAEDIWDEEADQLLALNYLHSLAV